MITDNKALTMAIAAAAILLLGAVPAYNTVNAKAIAQTNALNQMARWKSEYDSLRPYQLQWEKHLASAASVDDIYALQRIIGFEKYGLDVDTETLTVTRIEALNAPDGTPLDADRVCLATGGTQGIVATTANIYPTLINGIDQLAKRADIEIPSLSITVSGSTAKAVFPLCIRLRR